MRVAFSAKNNAEIVHSSATRDTCASAYLHQDGAEKVIYINGGGEEGEKGRGIRRENEKSGANI